MTSVNDTLRWFLTDAAGKYVIWQKPNLLVYITLLTLTGRSISEGSAREIWDLLFIGAVMVWAVMEACTGDSPFRKALGLSVLVATIVVLFAR